MPTRREEASVVSLTPGDRVLGRFKAEARGFCYGYVIARKASLVHIGPYNGASEGVWVEEDEIERRRYEYR